MLVAFCNFCSRNFAQPFVLIGNFRQIWASTGHPLGVISEFNFRSRSIVCIQRDIRGSRPMHAQSTASSERNISLRPLLPVPGAGLRRERALAHMLFGSVELAGIPLAYDRSAEIYGEGEAADYVYKVITGAVRTYKILNDGRRQINAFDLRGEIFGLEV